MILDAGNERHSGGGSLVDQWELSCLEVTAGAVQLRAKASLALHAFDAARGLIHRADGREGVLTAGVVQLLVFVVSAPWLGRRRLASCSAWLSPRWAAKAAEESHRGHICVKGGRDNKGNAPALQEDLDVRAIDQCADSQRFAPQHGEQRQCRCRDTRSRLRPNG